MSFGIQTVTSSLNELNSVRQSGLERESSVDKLERYGGIKLQSGTPQPRLDDKERPPELKSLHERAPYVARGERFDPVGRDSRILGPDPESELGQLLTSIGEQKEFEPEFFQECHSSLRSISDGYGLMKSPPEYGGSEDFSQQLRNKSDELEDKARQFDELFGRMQGQDIVEVDQQELTVKMSKMLHQAAKELGDYAVFVESLPDPRPTMKTIGHFKALETEGAIKVLDDGIKEKKKQINEFLQSNGQARFGKDQWGDLTNYSREEIDTLLQAEFEDLEPQQREALLDHMEGLKLLQQTHKDLELRRDTLDGKVGEGWTDTEPLTEKQLKTLVGAKQPKGIKAFFAKLGFGGFLSAFKAIRNIIRGGEMPPLSSPKAREGRMMAMLLSERFKQAGLENTSVKHLQKEIGEGHVEVLGKGQKWDTIEKKVTVTIDGEPRDFTSTLTPHNKLVGKPPLLEDGQGVCCHDAKGIVPSNVWLSELKDENGKVMVRNVRTGVIVPYEIEDVQRRKDVTKSRAMQLLCVQIGSNPKLLEEARKLNQLQRDNRDLPQNQKQEVPPLVVKNFWLSHLTPDGHRGGGTMKKDNERMMLQEQLEALRGMAGEDGYVDLFMDDSPNDPIAIKVDYKVLMFSCGVNWGGVKGGGLDVFSGWPWANEHINKETMQGLLGVDGEQGRGIGGWVVEALDTLLDEHGKAEARLTDLRSQPQRSLQDENEIAQLEQTMSEAMAKIERIDALAQQVQELWVSGDYMSQGEDPYKMSSRIGLLGYEVSDVLSSNCKSNKDRNSMGDVHMKDLSIQLHEKGELRGPDQPRSREEKINLRTLVRESGNSELQTLNVGGAGYKLEGVEQVFFEQDLVDEDYTFKNLGKFTQT